MIEWTQFTAGFSALLTRLSGISGVGPEQDGLGFTFPADDTCAELGFEFKRESTVGQDELRTAFDPDAVIDGDTSGEGGDPAPGGVVYSANGNREIIVEISCESHLQSTPAWGYIQKIRDALKLPSVRAELAALGVAVQKTGQIQNVSYTLDGSSVSSYVLEVWLNAMSNVSDEPVTTIQTVGVEYEVE